MIVEDKRSESFVDLSTIKVGDTFVYKTTDEHHCMRVTLSTSGCNDPIHVVNISNGVVFHMQADTKVRPTTGKFSILEQR